MTFYAGATRRLQESGETMNYGWAEKNLDVLKESVAEVLDYSRDVLVIELLKPKEASTSAFSLRIIMLLTEALQKGASPEEHIERIQQKLVGTPDSLGTSGLKAAIISELQEQGKPEPAGLRTATVEQQSSPVYKEEITYTLPVGSTSTTNSLAPSQGQPNEDSSSVATVLIVLSVVIAGFCIIGGAVTYLWLAKSVSSGTFVDEEAPQAPDEDVKAPVATDDIELDFTI